MPDPTRSRHAVHVSAFAAVLVLATFAALEIGSFAVLGLFPERWPSRVEIQQTLDDSPDARVVGGGSRRDAASRVLHPYLGFVRNPRTPPGSRVNRRVVEDSINEFGFFGVSPLEPRGEGVIRVALTGGSVAEELFLYGRETLRREIAASGAFGDREIEIVSMALAGFKQPQQLMAVSYLLVLGASFDVVINLDGFNEVVLPFTDNVPLKVAPSYPFRWSTVAARGIDPEAAILVARVAETRDDLERWRSVFVRAPLRHSSAALATWHLLYRRNEAKRAALETELRERLAGSDRAPQRGPSVDYDSDDALFADSVDVWRRASLQLQSVCDAHGVTYLHFLQPSQYVARSKRMTPGERRDAILPTRNSTRHVAAAVYPLLISAGVRLRDAGVRFVDLTQIFARERQPIYRDRCCHLFDAGYQIVARRIAHEVAAAGSDLLAASDE